MGRLYVPDSRVRDICDSTGSATFVPQYQELQESAQLQGNSMKEVQVQISQLRQAIQRLQSQIGSLRKQVRPQCLSLLGILFLHH